MKKTLAIIGSTGSVGKTTLEVFRKSKNLKLKYLCANNNYNSLNNQIKKFKPDYFHLFNLKLNKKLMFKKKNKPINFFYKKKIDFVVSGVSGFDSLDMNFELLKISKNLLIANKETLICGGDFFLKEAKKNNCNIIPIDSEHHCIDFFLKNFNSNYKIKEVSLIASGGPFWNKKINFNEKIKNVINHPNWNMGKKISVYSSNLTNKILELFEAHILFKIPIEKLSIKIENTSNIHSIITLENNISFLILHYPNMSIPISNSLNQKNDFSLKFKDKNLNITDPDTKKFLSLKIVKKILHKGHSAMIIFTVLNDRLTEMYLEKKIQYGEILKKLEKLFKKNEVLRLLNIKIRSKKDVLKLMENVKSLTI